MSGHAFEFTPMGIVPLGTNVGQMAEGAIAGATAAFDPPDVAQLALVPQRHPAAVSIARSAPTPGAKAAPLKPVDVVKLARARLREVERDIKRLKKLETERDELKRLLDAAAHKPRATIRSLPTRSA